MNFYEWLKFGYDKKWISDVVCATHDGIPMDDEEEREWEDGYDPCATIVRVYEPDSDSDLS